MPMKAVLFDFNGTLFCDTRFHLAAWHSFFEKVQGRDYPREELLRRCIGPCNDAIFRDFFGKELAPDQKKTYEKIKEDEYRAAVLADPRNTALRRGAGEFLDYLTENQIPFALATASPIENVEFYLEHLGLKKWFALDRIVYDDGNIPQKPHPAFYLEAARRLNLSPADCLIAEDSVTGIRSALAAGAGRIVALSGTTPMEKLSEIDGLFAIAEDFCGFERFLR